jgi:hypothetical protein
MGWGDASAVIAIHKEGKASHFSIGYNWKIIIYIAGKKKRGKELKSRYKGLLLLFTREDWSAESSETCVGEGKIV